MTSKVKVASISSLPRTTDSLWHKVSRTFGVGLETAERTIKATTQLALRNAILPIHRHFRTEVAQLRYPRLGGPHGKFYTDTLFAHVPSLSNFAMGQMFTNDLHFSMFYPMHRKSEAPDALLMFMQEIGIPSELHSDDAKELVEGRMKKTLKKFWVKPTQSEPYSSWQVRAELCIREVKRAVRDSLCDRFVSCDCHVVNFLCQYEMLESDHYALWFCTIF